MRTRVVPTASGKKAIQVVSKVYGKVTVHKHIGAYTTQQQKILLLEKAQKFITETTGQTSLLDILSTFRPSEVEITEQYPIFLYQLLSRVYDKLGFSKYHDLLIKDLVIARVWAPSSKRETREILLDDFGKNWRLLTIYRHLKTAIEAGLKESFQKALVDFARDGLGDDLRLIFYDVTTLYFESTAKEGIRDFGFSKDHKSQETQVMVGVVVNKDGFPLYFDVFSGSTFEGNTFLPVIKNIKAILGSTNLVIIADAAMISQGNIEKLVSENIGFVVGARIANLPEQLIDSISSQLNKQDSKIITTTYHGQKLICQYLQKRALKDKSDRLKQITRAESVISQPTRLRRYRFVKTEGQTISLNVNLIAKAEKLEGIKGYLTNTDLPESAVINRYHDLWRIENSFRLTKSDLEARPIFHRLNETIKAHLVIVFAGLAIARYLEIKSGMSIAKVLKLASQLLTQKVTNTATGETALIETTIKDPFLKGKIDLLKSLGH